MKIMINYDFFEKIRDVREPLGPLKIVRNNKQWFYATLPLDILLGMYFHLSSLTPGVFALQVGMGTTSRLAMCKSLGADLYAEISEYKLKKLVSQLKDVSINTSYDLLLESELYKKDYHIKLNENKIPYLLEKKYVLVPTYNYLNDIGETSILQEHVVGTKTYVLSIGSPQRQVRFAYSQG